MSPEFTTFIHVSRPVREVYEAIADPNQLSRYFTTGGAQGRIETGATVTWDFHDFPGAFPVEVVEAIPQGHIALRWGAKDTDAAENSMTDVTIKFEPTPNNRTKVSISERGWKQTAKGFAASYGNCMGWSQMLCALKVWLEHGINLREGAYK